jgi:predicted small integral membrane protein
MLATRIAKIGLLASVAFYFLIVVLNNAVFDYPSNYRFVQHVLSMDTLFSGEAQRWRAFPDPTPEDNSYWLYHAFYWSIIAWEAAAGLLCGLAACQLVVKLKAPAKVFNATKSLAIYGLSLSLLQWFIAFITVGAEWFLMWQSNTWNGQDAAARMFLILGVVLIFVAMKDEDPNPME